MRVQYSWVSRQEESRGCVTHAKYQLWRQIAADRFSSPSRRSTLRRQELPKSAVRRRLRHPDQHHSEAVRHTVGGHRPQGGRLPLKTRHCIETAEHIELIMIALWNRADHYIFAVVSSSSSFLLA